MSLHIGIDLDNTIIDYDAAFTAAAHAHGLARDVAGKTAVRDAIRALDDGNARWTHLQAEVYGPGIGAARLYAGVDDFLARAHDLAIPLIIISHKGEFAAAAPDGPNLRDCATAFLHDHGIALPLVFAATRAEKCRAIAAAGVTHFIDDLVEVFDDPAFPRGVERWLFAPHGAPREGTALRAFASWSELSGALPT
jgi:hypothetical protein